MKKISFIVLLLCVKSHYTIDVVAGALIGIGFSWYFTTPYKNLKVMPSIDNDTYGMQFNYKW